jgi:hypothetical protein
LERLLDAVCAKELFAFFALDWNVGKSLADAATCEVVDVLIFKIVDTDKVEAGGIDFVADFLFDAQVL